MIIAPTASLPQKTEAMPHREKGFIRAPPQERRTSTIQPILLALIGSGADRRIKALGITQRLVRPFIPISTIQIRSAPITTTERQIVNSSGYIPMEG